MVKQKVNQYGAFNGTGKGIPITEEEKKKLIELGVISLEKKESAMSVFVRVCEALSKQGFKFDGFKSTKTVNKKAVYTTLEDISREYPDIDIDKVLKETGVGLNYSIGAAKKQSVESLHGNGTPLITEEKKKLIELGVISLEKKERAMSVFVRVCEALSKQGFKFDEFKFTKKVDKKTADKTLEDISQEYPNIDIESILKDTEVELNYSLANAKRQLTRAIRGEVPITEEEKQRLIDLKVVNSESRLQKAKEQRDDAKIRNDKAKILEQEVSEQLKKRGKTHEEQ